VATRRVDFFGRLDGKRRTPQGGLRVDANLTRTGIFTYRGPRGETIREYRPADEVFKADSLETLKLAPLVIGHPDMVRADNFKSVNVGVVAENVRASGEYVASDVLVQDRKTIDAIEAGDLAELSCGYEVDYDPTPGVTESGEHYDGVQRNIRYNHVGLGPKGWGRAGSEVRLHLDGDGHVVLPVADAPAEVPTLARMPTIEEVTLRADKAEAERDALKAENAKLRADADAAKAESARKDGAYAKFLDPKEIPAMVAARVALEGSARAVLGAELVTVREDGTPVDELEIMRAAIVKHDPTVKLDGRNEHYVRARFEMLTEAVKREDASHANANASSATGGEAPAKSRLDLAIEAANTAAAEAAKAGPPAGALVRK
jgi:hypothetical protein